MTWTGRIFLGLFVAALLAMGFGMPPGDAVKMRLFSDAVERWQHNPDFRKVQVEYVELGSDAMRTRTAFVETTKGIMWLRSIPGLPEHLRVNDTSLRHYTNFTRGPLSAYLHLTTEQGVADTLKMLTALGMKANPTDEDIREFLEQYKLYSPVAKDAGAVQSVRSLLRDIDPGRGFEVSNNIRTFFDRHISTIAVQRRADNAATAVRDMLRAVDPWWASALRDNGFKLVQPSLYTLAHTGRADQGIDATREMYAVINPRDVLVVQGYASMLLKPEVAKVAAELGYPTDALQMTPTQQRDVWARLDDRIRETNYELWRVKQVNDWLNGVWAQVYGSMYASVIGPTLTIRDACQIVGPLALLTWVGVGLFRKREEEEEESPMPARLALEGGKTDGDQ